MGLFRRPSRWAGVDFYRLRPVRLVTHEEDDATGEVVLLVPRFRSRFPGRWLQSRLRPERRHVRVRLDARGSWIWRACDGQRPVAEIAAGFGEAFPAETEQLAERVCTFLYEMDRQGFVRLWGAEG